jgi:hypothetical protein
MEDERAGPGGKGVANQRTSLGPVCSGGADHRVFDTDRRLFGSAAGCLALRTPGARPKDVVNKGPFAGEVDSRPSKTREAQ